jgi:hypothetical protein
MSDTCKKIQKTVYISPGNLEWLYAESRSTGKHRSEIVETAIDFYRRWDEVIIEKIIEVIREELRSK